MSSVILDETACLLQRCVGGLCAARRVCPVKAIWQEEAYAVPFLSGGMCTGCSKCIAACPAKAFRVIGVVRARS